MPDNQEYAVHPMLMAEMYKETPEAIEETPEKQPEPEVQEPEVAPEETLSPKELTADENKKVRERISLLRQKAEKAERERDEMLRLLAARETQYKQPELEEEINYAGKNADDIAEIKDVIELKKELRALKKEIANTHTKSNVEIIEARIRSKFNDFDQVVNRENIELLNALDPETANALAKSPDLYDKAVATYNIIKKYNIDSYDKYSHEEKKIKENKAKPRSLASVTPQQGESPLSRANIFAEGLTPEVKKMLQKEMEEAIKNRNRSR